MSITSQSTTAAATSSEAEIATSEWEALLGRQVRALRLDAGHDQVGLARLAGIGLTALKTLELGRGSTLHTLVRVLRALDAVDWLETLAPQSQVSPLDVLRRADAEPRKRVYRPRKNA